MADRRPDHTYRSGADRHHDRRSLVAALRREARAERPRFSPTLHEGVVAALATRAASRPTASRTRRPVGFAGGLAAAAACAALAVVTAVPRSVTPATDPVATNPVATNPVATNPVATNPVATNPVATNPVATVPEAAKADAGIERLPTPEEIGTSVFTHVATLAALAVGVADIPDLPALDSALLATADDQGP